MNERIALEYVMHKYGIPPKPRRKRSSASRRSERLKRKYGLTHETWEAILDEQGGCCAICKSANHKHTNWHTDHCHKTGVVRGLLCRDCNHLLGLAKDDPCILEDAIHYLNKPRRNGSA